MGRKRRKFVRNINISKKELEDLYIVKKMSMEKIAETLGVSTTTIGKRMKKFGIQTRRLVWNGGKKMTDAKTLSKRRGLDFDSLNLPFPNSHAHHLQDGKTVIFIPKEIHQRIWHNHKTGQNMNTIDALALYFLELQILGEVS
jgi:hypothetical protein